ncbi:putative methyltransferase-domain-containing protein [Schizophyllum amplum]|uniref:Putative methyltransferase-domain-containing protein n=1 Tax=Schizophyllum amplum TaxID=97359 RepID=A0A550BZH0_9AGAR|nr:putative methyltransferase-domain-containing protein [Auriculariopsis ampla]
MSRATSDSPGPSNPPESSEDVLSDALFTLYDYQPITHASAGQSYTYNYPSQTSPLSITLTTPDTDAANWELHASSIWMSAVYLADHIDEISLPPDATVLELGAGAGLPSIVLAALHPQASITISDYPDQQVLAAIHENIERNKVVSHCRAAGFAWGTNPEPLLRHAPAGYDVVLAADTLWNPTLRESFIDSIEGTLRKSEHARAYIVAGLHTGRYTLQAFLDAVQKSSKLAVVSLVECEARGTERRTWDVTRADNDDDKERRRWVLWIVLKWKP